MAERATARTRIRSNPNRYAKVLEIRAITCFARDFTSYQKEAPRLCRGGSRSLTFQEVVHRRDFQS